MIFLWLADQTYQSFFRTLYSMAKFAGLRDPVTFDFEGSSIAYCVDAFSISMGALVGCSPVTAYIESATGISGESWPFHFFLPNIQHFIIEGGKTGLTAITTGVMFFVSIFFAPIFASIPSWATGGALTIVGCLMIRKCVSNAPSPSIYTVLTDRFCPVCSKLIGHTLAMLFPPSSLLL